MTRSKTSPARSGGWSPRHGLLAGVGVLAFAPAVAAIWLFLAAIPVFADGGPHVSSINNGSGGINADSCAGCHRAHTAQGPYLIQASDEEALCLTCHGSAVAGATTDVMTGVQYALGTNGLRGTPQLGALRNGGFDQARLDTGNAARRSYSAGAVVEFLAKVPVRSGPQDVTSAHLDLDGADGVVASGIAWGNGPFDANVGPEVSLTCASCHNPHGNGQYRILNPIPDPPAVSGAFTPLASPGASVKDAPLPAADDARNYTVIQVKGTQGTNATYLLYASQVLAAAAAGSFNGIPGTYGPTGGDYFHRYVPWNATSPASRAQDAPNGLPANRPAASEVAFNTQITAWCSACHTRYQSSDAFEDTGDVHYRYRHATTTDRACTTCHVSHGSNAQMTGPFSANMAFPDGSQKTTPNATPPPATLVVPDSRLLKIDSRGTCQACHDPTGTIPAGTFNGPTPVPLVP